jgi:preprotein translocase subunit SecD
MQRSILSTSSAALMLSVSTACATLAQTSGGSVAPERAILQVRLAQEAPGSGFVFREFVGRPGGVYVAERTIVSDDGIERVRVRRTATGLLLRVYFSPEGAARLAEATKAAVGRQLALLANSRLAVSSPIVSPTAPADNAVTIVLQLPPEAAREVAASIAARWPEPAAK